MDDTTRRAATGWAAIVGAPTEALTEPGMTVIPRDDERAQVAWLRIVGTVVAVPPELVPTAEALGEDATFDELLDALGDRVAEVTGPARMGWLPDDWTPAIDRVFLDQVTELDAGDHRISAFHRRLPPTDQQQWSVRAVRAHVLVHGGRVVSAALTAEPDDTLAHLGVATATDERLRGHASVVTAAACLDAIERGRVPQYRADEHNRGSWALAARVGFVDHARQALAHLHPS